MWCWCPRLRRNPNPIAGKGKTKETTAVGSDDDDMDNPPAKSKPSGSQEKKGGRGRGKSLAAVRFMTTGVSLLDDVIEVGLLSDISGARLLTQDLQRLKAGRTNDNEADGLYASHCQGLRSNGNFFSPPCPSHRTS